MSLNNHSVALDLRERMENHAQYAKIVAGPKTGSIGRIVDINQKFFSSHDYRLNIKGHRSFWAKGSDLEHLPNHQGDTIYVQNNIAPEYCDLIGRPITVGKTIIFSRRLREGTKTEMVMGTVQRISSTGAIYAKLFKGALTEDLDAELVRVGKPACAMILDRSTMDQVMLAKMGMF